jgi:hypothetical protein
MIISPGRKYIFVHIPKTGGTSLALALEARAMADDILIGDTPKAVKRRARVKKLQGERRLWKHSSLSDVEGMPGVGRLEDYLVVTLIRNPWDRMVSYYHWLRGQTFAHRAVELAKAHEFTDFLRHPEMALSLKAERYAQYVENSANLEVNTLFIDLKKSKNEIDEFERHLGFSLDLPQANASGRDPDWRRYFSDADAALVGQLYAEDIARFGYHFDPD